jgi:hypothetical protein
MEEFASLQETQRALGVLLKLQEDPETLEGFFNKYPGANPFTSWPFLKGPTEAFLRYFETIGPVPGVEAAVPLSNSVDELKLKELVEEFDREFAAAKERRVNASTASKKFVSALVENAKQSHVTIPRAGGTTVSPEHPAGVVGGAGPYPMPPVPQTPMPQAPVPQEARVAPGPPERTEEVIGVAAPYPVPPVPQAPVPQEVKSVPISPERMQRVINATLQYPGPPEEKILVFHALTSFASEQPDREVKDLIHRAVEVTEAARVLSTPEETLPRVQSFSVLATNNFQKDVAGVLDVVVPPPTKAAVVDNVLLGSLDAFVNHPETLPQNVIKAMTDRWGTNFVNSGWFTQLRDDTNRMIVDQKGALKVTTPFTAFVSDVATTVFRSPQDKNILILSREALVQDINVADRINKAFALSKNVLLLDKNALTPGIGILALDSKALAPGSTIADQVNKAFAPGKNVLLLDKNALPLGTPIAALNYNVITYIETYRLMATQGIPMVSVSHYSNIALGYGGQLVRMGADYVMRKGIKAGIKAAAKKAAVSTAVKVGAEAVAGAASGGTLTLAMMAVDFAKSLINKGAALLKSLFFMGSSKNPEDNLILVVAAGILLLFFLPLFPLINTPAFNQSMIDTSIATSVGSGPGGPYVPGAPQGELVIWAYSGSAPVTNITSSSQLGCPVRGGTVTQGPNGSFSHQGIQAYDIASSLGAPIYATHDAYVVSFRDGIPPYTFLNNSYGNYVLLVGQLPSGSKFFTIYGHLLSVDPIVQQAFGGTRSRPCKNNDPKLICAGETIGTEDATGSTWGTQPGNGIHLHYQSQGLGSLVLPAGCP